MLVLVLISPVVHDIEHLSMGSFAICVPSLEKYLFRSFACF